MFHKATKKQFILDDTMLNKIQAKEKHGILTIKEVAKHISAKDIAAAFRDNWSFTLIYLSNLNDVDAQKFALGIANGSIRPQASLVLHDLSLVSFKILLMGLAQQKRDPSVTNRLIYRLTLSSLDSDSLQCLFEHLPHCHLLEQVYFKTLDEAGAQLIAKHAEAFKGKQIVLGSRCHQNCLQILQKTLGVAVISSEAELKEIEKKASAPKIDTLKITIERDPSHLFHKPAERKVAITKSKSLSLGRASG